MKANKKEQAFLFYYSLGSDRTLQEVADKFGLSLRSLKQYSIDGKWKERIAELEEKAKIELNERLMKIAEQKRLEYLQGLLAITQLTINKYAETIVNANRVQAKDIEILINLVRELTGENVNTVNINTTTELKQEDKEALKEFSSNIVALINSKADED